jgi:hypothetical protein
MPSVRTSLDRLSLAVVGLAELVVRLGLFVREDTQQLLLVCFAVALVWKGQRMGGTELVHHRIFLDGAYWLLMRGGWEFGGG